jgi:hypothetical protein
MNPRGLVDHIRSGPTELVLEEPLRFRRRTRSNPCDFNEFLEALQSNETIRRAVCGHQKELSISEAEWVLLVKTLGSIKDIHHLEFFCTHGSRRFRPFQAVAEAVSSAHSVCKLEFGLAGEVFFRDSSGLIALANSLREHPALQEFTWFDFRSNVQLETVQIAAFDPVLLALPACLHLRTVAIMARHASCDATKNLLQLQSATELTLVLYIEQWLAVADEIRQGRCNIRVLHLTMIEGTISDASDAVQKIANAIRFDSKLERLTLKMENGFTDEAGVALAEALTVNTTLRQVRLLDNVVLQYLQPDKATLGAQSYEAFSAMLRVNTSLVLKVLLSEAAGADATLRNHVNQMIIEQRLNQVGRGRLVSSRQVTKQEWVDALHELNSCNADDPPAFEVSCLYSLLRSNPSAVQSILCSVPHL